ncbi:hypothetical protein [Bradyrhizobium liaoningense]|uniref:hypothetical protein n=1 Tax=Bradyrhizobium liaoningense TaxID=43992 RepID=UPI001BAA839B|nr:hypothetical protein [Bradyrhizobium liaoningense]MBR0854641.1 hypothetical protein [Bradyrhizobium liaoningense]
MRIAKFLVVFLALPGVAMAALTNAERKSQFERAMASIIAASTPTVFGFVRDTLIKDYLACKPNKGQAVELVKASYFRSCEHEDASVTGDRSLEACQLRYGKPCALLAVNEEIVAEGELVSRDMPRLHYAGKYDLSQIPIIRRITRQRPEVQSYDKAMEPKAMAIHPWGKVFISAGDPSPTDAQASALAKCNSDPARNGRDGGCFVYAVNNDVVIDERRMQPK